MITKVTCALIEQFGCVLITQRSESMSQALLWEFPGGKIEDGETEAGCLIREIEEELSLSVTPMQRLTPVVQVYGDKTIELIPYICQYNSGTIKLAEHRAYHWVLPQELANYYWCPADIPIVQEYVALAGEQFSS
ncbi:(deoxy)nucleoside triphosphate pyrophosphohydrolase [Pontibacter sp. HSC-14F20]|uniref:(deoxy)nucleoside triphosphate pyrophosphohydrolase n=1 Tax=Pontibacter sp. HSC-14F20 TaxID=2864136 RepID=UPI001C737394|nr:(deoxy)nucleoside triphosphate pyrophosphohydrolase [Pontibacter sp. HSC-14F20]MBX0334676.1 (deoxy)nucleoside triphosphate pyrophosphohydrolase [Pontibacter sp. HSC-14F20]